MSTPRAVATELIGNIADLPDGRTGEIITVWVNDDNETMVTLKLRTNTDRHRMVEARTMDLLLHPTSGWY